MHCGGASHRSSRRDMAWIEHEPTEIEPQNEWSLHFEVDSPCLQDARNGSAVSESRHARGISELFSFSRVVPIPLAHNVKVSGIRK